MLLHDICTTHASKCKICDSYVCGDCCFVNSDFAKNPVTICFTCLAQSKTYKCFVCKKEEYKLLGRACEGCKDDLCTKCTVYLKCSCCEFPVAHCNLCVFNQPAWIKAKCECRSGTLQCFYCNMSLCIKCAKIKTQKCGKCQEEMRICGRCTNRYDKTLGEFVFHYYCSKTCMEYIKD
jgi:hypothetical protein